MKDKDLIFFRSTQAQIQINKSKLYIRIIL